MTEMKTNTFLKVMAIIMLVCGILAAVVSLIPIAISVLGALVGLSFGDMALLLISTAFLLVSVVLQIVAGAKGLAASKDPAKAPACVKIGIAIIALSLLSNILSAMAPTGSFDITSFITSCIVPGLYVFSASQK